MKVRKISVLEKNKLMLDIMPFFSNYCDCVNHSKPLDSQTDFPLHVTHFQPVFAGKKLKTKCSSKIVYFH